MTLIDVQLNKRPDWVDDPNQPLASAWWDFHSQHPEVARELFKRARPLAQQGRKRLGISMLFEHLRYETYVGARPDEDVYHLNNNHRAYYALWMMEVDPSLDGLFEVRRRGR